MEEDNSFPWRTFRHTCKGLNTTLQQVEVTASSLVPTAQEQSVMRNRVQTQLSPREDGRSFSRDREDCKEF